MGSESSVTHDPARSTAGIGNLNTPSPQASAGSPNNAIVDSGTTNLILNSPANYHALFKALASLFPEV